MIDLDMLEFSLGLVESTGRDIAEIKCESVRELIERLREAEKDAARYQWLLDNCTTQQADSCGPIFVMTIRRNKNPNNIGLSIDEAMNDLMDEKVRCPYCESEVDDFTAEADFIGWHGMCVKCFLSEESNA